MNLIDLAVMTLSQHTYSAFSYLTGFILMWQAAALVDNFRLLASNWSSPKTVQTLRSSMSALLFVVVMVLTMCVVVFTQTCTQSTVQLFIAVEFWMVLVMSRLSEITYAMMFASHATPTIRRSNSVNIPNQSTMGVANE